MARLLLAMVICPIALLRVQAVATQLVEPDRPVDRAARQAAIEQLLARLEAGYVVPEGAAAATKTVRAALSSGTYEGLTTARAFAEKLTADLRAASQDRHLAVYFDPEPSPTPDRTSPASSTPPRERFNYGFYKIERLLGNVGYLELRSFANLDDAKQTAATYLDGLSNFDAIVIDLRQNGGGNTPMVAFVASYFLGPAPVHFTDMYWRDEQRTVEVWTTETVPGRRSTRQDLFILVGPQTFSAAEDFSYGMQQLKRATLVGETTGGGAHMGRGLQRLSPLFTAFIPTGQSINPVTKTNWENVGVAPDIAVPAARALIEAHLIALRRLLDREKDPAWHATLKRAIETVSAGR